MDPANPSTAPPQPAAASHPVHSADPLLSFHREPPPRPEVPADNDAVQEGLQPLDVEILSHLGADGRIHNMHLSRPDEWYECLICHKVYESAQVFSAHTGIHYRALSTASNVIRLRRKHDKELQNNKLQLLEFDDGSSCQPLPFNCNRKKENRLVNPNSHFRQPSSHVRFPLVILIFQTPPLYESAQVFSAHTGVHYRALSTAANVIRLHRKHHKELQNNKLRLLKFDDGSVALVPVNPTSTEVKKKIDLLDGRDDALGGESDHRNGTDLVVGRHDHHASVNYISMRAKKKRSRALGVGGIAAPQSGRGRDDNVKSSPVVAPQEHSGCP
ncbi:unnamed protein product [Malus baccata var. baccata]